PCYDQQQSLHQRRTPVKLPTLIVRDSLADREAHLWYVLTETATDPDWLSECERILSPDEKERWQRFTFAAGRHQYLVSHGFLRLILSRYADLPPEGWRF